MNILMVFSASGRIAPSHIKINPLADVFSANGL
jgi:hypothetical protein